MRELLLVDLDAQADEVANYIRGWPIDVVLKWMSKYGVVEQVNRFSDDKLYLFQSARGIRTDFRFDKNSELIIVREHSIYRPNVVRFG